MTTEHDAEMPEEASHAEVVADIRRRLIWAEQNWDEPIGTETMALPPLPPLMEQSDYENLFGQTT